MPIGALFAARYSANRPIHAANRHWVDGVAEGYLTAMGWEMMRMMFYGLFSGAVLVGKRGGGEVVYDLAFSTAYSN
ncbi:MAG: hypothetical protein DHS20C11_05390 [Lysobacteraceae bacterium]|nr:MAG: hypothetical protein DHS20C11_05390 [Xanthomonadaceae bacterium]